MEYDLNISRELNVMTYHFSSVFLDRMFCWKRNATQMFCHYRLFLKKNENSWNIVQCGFCKNSI